MNDTMGEMNNLILFYEAINKIIDDRVEDECKQQEAKKYKHQSKDIDKLAYALSQARKDFKPLTFNRTNLVTLQPYVDLYTIFEATSAALAAQELALTQKIITHDSSTHLLSLLLHSSGQYQECRVSVPVPEGDTKLFASILNEHKKQHILALLALSAAEWTEDDDCERENEIKRRQVKAGTSKEYLYKKEIPSAYESINKQQLSELEYLLSDDDIVDLYDEILKSNGIETLADLPVKQYRNVYGRINEIKAARRRL